MIGENNNAERVQLNPSQSSNLMHDQPSQKAFYLNIIVYLMEEKG